MPKSKNARCNRREQHLPLPITQKLWFRALSITFILTLTVMAVACGGANENQPTQTPSAPAQPSAQPASGNQIAPQTQSVQSPSCAASLAKSGEPANKMEVNKAVMVTVELDFGPRIPSIAEALGEIERCYKADDGSNTRTFAILDAYGEPTPDKKLLHLSMHVSTEKSGIGMLVFKRTGEVLWHNRILPTTQVSQEKRLAILVDAGGGRTYTVDGSTKPSSVLEANAKELGQPIKSIWADGTEREVTFIYSACGCPVKVMVRRVGNKTVRTKDTPVIFPDDPAVVTVISRLMGWS